MDKGTDAVDVSCLCLADLSKFYWILLLGGRTLLASTEFTLQCLKGKTKQFYDA